MGQSDDGIVVAPRKAIAQLKEAPEKLELMLRWCPETDASVLVPGEVESINGIVRRLGTLDRHHYLESVKRYTSEERVPLVLCPFQTIRAPGFC